MAAAAYEKILAQKPKDNRAKLQLGSIYAHTDLKRAEALLSSVEVPNLIQDYNALVKLENEISLSRAKESELPTSHKEKDQTKVPVVNKKISKKKRKVKLPKNFDPKNPGPLPDPERWLPKHERKGYKKKKGMKSRTQGTSNVGQETMNVFQTRATTAFQNVESSATQKKRNNRRR